MSLLLFCRVNPHAGPCCLEMSAEGTVFDLKTAIFEAGGPPPHLQVLTCAGADLVNDTMQLADSGLSMQAEIGLAEARARQPRLTGADGYALAALDGGLEAWGRIKTKNLPVPPGAHVVGAVAGYFHVVALLADGTCIGWDSSRNGTWEKAGCDPVPNLHGQRALSIGAGLRFSVALLEDGRVSISQLPGTRMQEPDFRGQKVECVSVCGWHCLALTEDGRACSFGPGQPSWSGQQADHNDPDFGEQKVTHISQGPSFCCAVLEGKKAVCWDQHGQSAFELEGDDEEFFVEVAAARLGVVGLTNKRNVVQWAHPAHCDLEAPPAEVMGGVAESVGAGTNFFMALLKGGRVVSWNKNPTEQATIVTCPPLPPE